MCWYCLAGGVARLTSALRNVTGRRVANVFCKVGVARERRTVLRHARTRAFVSCTIARTLAIRIWWQICARHHSRHVIAIARRLHVHRRDRCGRPNRYDQRTFVRKKAKCWQRSARGLKVEREAQRSRRRAPSERVNAHFANVVNRDHLRSTFAVTITHAQRNAANGK